MRINANLYIDPSKVQSMKWDWTGGNVPTLTIRMADGDLHQIKHQPCFLDGDDGYRIEKMILESVNVVHSELVNAIQEDH